jgi:hypothetical protein
MRRKKKRGRKGRKLGERKDGQEAWEEGRENMEDGSTPVGLESEVSMGRVPSNRTNK